MNKFYQYIGVLLLSLTVIGCTEKEEKGNYKLLSVEEYNDAVYASWIGQIVGNTYGLGYEFKFIDEPGPDKFPYGYDFTLEDLKKHNGAYSDDDTDIEYMYLTQMEKNGIEPSYKNLANAWSTHVKERVWFANRMAVTLINAGHFPPVSGSIGYNTEWFQIDPQLVNEIWAVTSPGMINYAVEKSEFSARITNDSFGIDPTLHYAAMYSAAFFEKDIHKLIDIGTESLPKNSRFKAIVENVKKWHSKHPNDWQKARALVKEHYYVVEDYNRHSWAVVDANLNGAYGIMALLYGDGDFQKTLDYSCAFGMDADNQAATMCGLLGIVNGSKSIPHDLMFPVEGANWKLPFNDQYKMITREGLSDETLTNLAKRTAIQGERIIKAYGGEVITKGGKQYYKINTDAKFVAPFELNTIPKMAIEVNHPFNYPIYTGGNKGDVKVKIEGELPKGIALTSTALEGTPTEVGTYAFDIIAEYKGEVKAINVKFDVHSKNLASTAKEVVYNKNSTNKNIELIRNGTTKETYYSTKKGTAREVDFYGYKWDKPQTISALIYNNGQSGEFCGWFTSFEVEVLKNGKWVKLEGEEVSPKMNLDNSQWLKPCFMNYEITFKPVTTKGIRIVGLGGGIEKDANNAHLGIQYYTSISELSVFEK
ncbi:ADP-ribosylglycohydrolase family protein [Flammeovirga kamogawensis]|uniref:ADP-ribosylglycohydrolase family protein n=1 Tax=Flammeovirga kamogawensis TaxID=373891 RepID=A0ABX8H3E1_9BACT|nr:ADP-ribosylglycohydrolase family protein [Flammeovirga kamogawensis]MBB6463114.1 hypothetical protein [Flammeovirga kamogawensis]QWG10350.1 ADP-ribosylglycohydrolase family protein [Flammeovirga kamogawensis]TRX63859.1 hypothetical protein EO216_25950 [Flammeovirga kamogawensis]